MENENIDIETLYFIGTDKNINEFKLKEPSFDKIMYLAKHPDYARRYGDYVYPVIIKNNLKIFDARKYANLIPLIKDKKIPKIIKFAYSLNDSKAETYKRKTIDFLDICNNFKFLMNKCFEHPHGFSSNYSVFKPTMVVTEEIAQECIEFCANNSISDDAKDNSTWKKADNIRKLLNKIIISNTNYDCLTCDESITVKSKVLYCVDIKNIDKIDLTPVFVDPNPTDEYWKLLKQLNIKHYPDH